MTYDARALVFHSPFVIRHSTLVGLLALGALTLSGCSGRALVHTIPLGTQKINTEGPLLLRETLPECYYWVNEQQKLCVAMRRLHRSIFGKLLERELVMSFELPGVPAAGSRDYRMDRSTARVFSRFGIYPQRGGSQSGIITVWDFGHGPMRGRFRFNARQQTYSVLTGWSAPTTTMYVGEFTAVENRSRGETILKQTNAPGLERAPTPGKGSKERTPAERESIPRSNP